MPQWALFILGGTAVSEQAERTSECDEIAEIDGERGTGQTGADAVALWPLVMLRSDKWHFTAPSPR